MTPFPIDLPIRPPAAAELARPSFQQVEGKRLSDDERGRVASRAAQMRLESIRPWFGSLFLPDDADNIGAFVACIDPASAPRPQGARPAIAIAAALPEGFDAFRSALRPTGKNLAAVCGVAFTAAQWAAIRTGWCEGYSAVGDGSGFTHFVVETGDASAASASRSRPSTMPRRSIPWLALPPAVFYKVSTDTERAAASVEFLAAHLA